MTDDSDNFHGVSPAYAMHIAVQRIVDGMLADPGFKAAAREIAKSTIDQLVKDHEIEPLPPPPPPKLYATLCKQFTFDAAHCLDRLPADHKCHRMHGHTYRVDITITGPADKNGFVIDYAVMDEMWRPLHEQLDHRVLNDVEGLEIPSTENVGAWIHNHLIGTGLVGGVSNCNDMPALTSVRVHESTSTWCEVGGYGNEPIPLVRGGTP